MHFPTTIIINSRKCHLDDICTEIVGMILEMVVTGKLLHEVDDEDLPSLFPGSPVAGDGRSSDNSHRSTAPHTHHDGACVPVHGRSPVFGETVFLLYFSSTVGHLTLAIIRTSIF